MWNHLEKSIQIYSLVQLIYMIESFIHFIFYTYVRTNMFS